MNLVMFLKICTVGLSYGDGLGPAKHCEVYELRPQYVMTQEEIDGKVEHICKTAVTTSHELGGHVTLCEVIGELQE